MAGGESSPTQLPPAKRRNEASATTIHSLGEDLLLAIFLHLPSLATLIRAALTCRQWRRAVASSPAFRRRFRALHPPPLLGLFFEAPALAQVPNVPAFPAFAPTRRRDRDLAAAIRGGDFFLTSLHDGIGETPCWDVIDCSHGCVLLLNWDDELLVVMNPLTRRTENAFDMCPQGVFDGSRDHEHRIQLSPRLLCSVKNPQSFLVVFLAYDKSRVRVTVFSSDTQEWEIHPWVKVPAPTGSDENNYWIQNVDGMQSSGFMYWVYTDRRHLILLEPKTMKLSVTELPQCLSHCTFDVGETQDGATCIIYSNGLNIGVLMYTRDDGGIERWVLDREVPLGGELKRVLQAGWDDEGNRSELFVLAAGDGHAYLATSWMYHDPSNPCWFLSLCLETKKLEKLFRGTFDNTVHPYVMAWPSSLVGNYGRFAFEVAP